MLTLARRLVGQVIVHRTPAGISAGRIVETEAYRGPADLAAHSSGGRRTKRTEAMFGAPGHAYVFLLYGSSWAFNIVAGRKELEPHAVLIRAVEPVHGAELMAERRGLAATRRELSNGPGKLCQALGIDRSHYGCCLYEGDLFVTAGARGAVGRSPRVNIDYAGAWVTRPWRFYERSNRYVSVRPRD